MVVFMMTGAGLTAGVGYASYKMYRHSRKDYLKSGSICATPKNTSHPLWNAVVDNYVYVHNAFRNDLSRLILLSSSSSDDSSNGNKLLNEIRSSFSTWKEALEVHSKIEDELFLPFLQARLKRLDEKVEIPEALTNGKDHEHVEALILKVEQAIQEAMTKKEGNEKTTNVLQIIQTALQNLQKAYQKSPEFGVYLSVSSISADGVFFFKSCALGLLAMHWLSLWIPRTRAKNDTNEPKCGR